MLALLCLHCAAGILLGGQYRVGAILFASLVTTAESVVLFAAAEMDGTAALLTLMGPLLALQLGYLLAGVRLAPLSATD